MKPLAELDARAVRGLLFDIDDTLTTDGKLTADAYAALERLKRAGKVLVPVTGRPAGWCDHIARMWPVDAVVGENGAFYFWHDPQAGRLGRRYQDSAAARAARRAQLDYCEDVPALPLDAAERIAALMREAGLTAKISSIHVNGWFGSYDKLAMCRVLCAERFGVDLEADNHAWVFVGDSPNDAPMFGFFERSVGVANVARFAAQLAAAPKFVTQAAAGAGFAELATHLLKGA